jgi:hypothetical protein
MSPNTGDSVQLRLIHRPLSTMSQLGRPEGQDDLILGAGVFCIYLHPPVWPLVMQSCTASGQDWSGFFIFLRLPPSLAAASFLYGGSGLQYDISSQQNKMSHSYSIIPST